MLPGSAPNLSDPAYTCVQDSRLRLLLDTWRTVRGDRHLPDRRDFDPLDMVPILPMLWMCDYEPAADIFRFRLAGERIREAHGQPIIGYPVTDLVQDDGHKQVLHGILKRVIDEPLVLFTDGYLYHCQERYVRGCRLIFPMTSNDGMGLIGVTAMHEGPAEFDMELMKAPILKELPLP